MPAQVVAIWGTSRSLGFGSPDASSMGKLLALSLACTLAAAVLFQPALMGKPRTITDDSQ